MPCAASDRRAADPPAPVPAFPTFHAADQDRYAFLVVDSDAETDLLEQVLPFDAQGLRNLSFYDGALWGLFRFAGWQLDELDPGAGKVVCSYTLPRPDGFDAYLGLASLNGRIYLIAEKSDTYELYSVAP